VPIPSHGVIITAAGSSSRFLNSIDDHSVQKKEFILLDDRSVLYHATQPFLNTPGVAAVVVTYPEGRLEETEFALDNILYAYSVPVILVQGGSTRQESVYLALEHLSEMNLGIEFVAIHDGARPWITGEVIIRTLATANIFGGSAPILTINDALKRVDSEGLIVEHVQRNGIVSVQTPQIFKFPMILDAHKAATGMNKIYVDDTEIFADFGGLVAASPGDSRNLKITTIMDISQTNNNQV
jgi:2-C-methyl-D-erythritol 4-phosphate cytidylyltransferase